MAASLPAFFSVNPRGLHLKRSDMRRRRHVIKVHQNYQDEGRSTNMVDANINVLKERIEMVKVKERLERCCKCRLGWNYGPLPSHGTKRNKELLSLIELTGLVCGTVGLTCFAGTLFLCLLSLLVHLQL